MYASSVCLSVCALTVDLQHFGGLLWRLCEGHMVNFAGVGHSIITSVHMQLQKVPYCKCLPTCIHLFGTFGDSCIVVIDTTHLACEPELGEASPCNASPSSALQTQPHTGLSFIISVRNMQKQIPNEPKI